ncbi:hypothetical protein GCK72_020803 [Caenorhabditis remanei]|uniref:Uncharacterized protein n=1 Tax=Caenorhabditis remanei TaxID=31234 RepID=A0A6A5GHU6_CAERE|nr:hypothetical protein GCK72_020803 [Caenorhabditis remanei]KAF1754243.1 hypothetical protein GCK72_020803 [Caenorhabditis remanei]
MPPNIWNTNLDVYYYVKRSFNLFLTPVFPLILYCVHKKSPKNFGSLKYFLYFHVTCHHTTALLPRHHYESQRCHILRPRDILQFQTFQVQLNPHLNRHSHHYHIRQTCDLDAPEENEVKKRIGENEKDA